MFCYVYVCSGQSPPALDKCSGSNMMYQVLLGLHLCVLRRRFVFMPCLWSPLGYPPPLHVLLRRTPHGSDYTQIPLFRSDGRMCAGGVVSFIHKQNNLGRSKLHLFKAVFIFHLCVLMIFSVIK